MDDAWRAGAGADHVRRTTRHYAVYGGVLETSIEMPELRETAPGAPDWSFEIVAGPAPAGAGGLLGERQIGPEWYRLWEIDGGYRLEYSHAGVFDLFTGSGRVVWYERPSAVMELVRTIVLGSALAVLLEASGLGCFHGSAVAIDGEAVMFIAPKHHGKSTFACALATRGARLISDDLVAVEVGGGGVSVRDGVASVRLWDDVVEALDLVEACERVVPGIKNTATGFKGDTGAPALTPLAAIYLMSPQPAAEHPELTRTPVRGADAVMALAQHTKLPSDLVGLPGAANQLRLATGVTARVPVYRLGIPDDIDRLPATIAQLQAWHAVPTAAPAGVVG